MSQPEISTHLVRMVLERNELNARLEKALAFTDSQGFIDLSREHQALLDEQIAAMQTYFVVLNKRINLMKAV